MWSGQINENKLLKFCQLIKIKKIYRNYVLDVVSLDFYTVLHRLD